MNKLKRAVLVASFCLMLAAVPVAAVQKDRNVYISGGFTGIAQSSMGNSYDPLHITDRSVATYSFDLNLHSRLPSGGHILAHLETGDGNGMNDLMAGRTSAASGALTIPHPIAPNYDVFSYNSEGLNASQSQAVNLSEVYLEQPMFRDRVLLDIGKMDGHALYDRNKFAGDETSQFMAGPLVRMTGTVFNEFKGYYAPTLRVLAGITPWLHVNFVGMFNYESVDRDATYAIETNLRTDLGGRKGNYRIYMVFDNRPYLNTSGAVTVDNGFGLSFDQYITRETGFFFRYASHAGTITENLVESAISFGVQMENMFGERGDTLGIGMAMVTNNSNASLVSSYSGPMLMEIYYKLDFGRGFSITPDFQFHSGMNRETSNSVMLLGIRVQADF